MSRHIVKPTRDVDLYVVWSSNTDSPLAWGSKEHLLQDGWVSRDESGERRFQRADETSTSAIWYTTSWDEDEPYGFMNTGSIPRSRIPELLTVLEQILNDGSEYKNPRVIALLTPFED